MEKKEKEFIEGSGKNIYYLLKIIGWAIVYGIVFDILTTINPETMVQNFQIGIIIILIGCFFFIPPVDKLLFRPKKIWRMVVLFGFAWIIADWVDFTNDLAFILGF